MSLYKKIIEVFTKVLEKINAKKYNKKQKEMLKIDNYILIINLFHNK